MSAQCKFIPDAPEPQQQRLPGVIADFPACVGEVIPLSDGRALLCFDGYRLPYASVERAHEGLRGFRNMGLCS